MNRPFTSLCALLVVVSASAIACGPQPVAETVTHSESANLQPNGVRTETDVRRTRTVNSDGSRSTEQVVQTNQTAPTAQPTR